MDLLRSYVQVAVHVVTHGVGAFCKSFLVVHELALHVGVLLLVRLDVQVRCLTIILLLKLLLFKEARLRIFRLLVHRDVQRHGLAHQACRHVTSVSHVLLLVVVLRWVR